MQLDVAGNLEEVAGIGAGHVGDAADLPLAPQQAVVIEFGDAIEVNGVDGNHSTFAQAAERRLRVTEKPLLVVGRLGIHAYGTLLSGAIAAPVRLEASAPPPRIART